MMHRIIVISLVCLLGTFSLPISVQADTIQITSGMLTTSGGPFGSGSISIAGEREFSFTAGFGLPFVFFAPSFCDVSCGPPQSTTLGTGGVLVGSDLIGTATLDGVTYLQVGSLAVSESMFVQLGGPPLLLPSATGDATVTLLTPFVMTGHFDYSGGVINLLGGGTASLTFTAVDPDLFPGSTVGPWRFESSSYDFTPVPEPGSLSLVTLGVIGIWRRRVLARRSRRISGN